MSTRQYIHNLTRNTPQINRLKTLKKYIRNINADKEDYAEELYSLTKNFTVKNSHTRQKLGTVGFGTFGTAELETAIIGPNESAIVVTKYTNILNSQTIANTICEFYALKYLSGCPNIVPLVAVTDKTTDVTQITDIPVLILARADYNLTNKALYKDAHLNKIYSLIVQVLRSVDILHSNRVVHCDIKPNNFLYNSAGELKSRVGEVWLSDFGSARYIPPMTAMHTDISVGTLLYASPEILLAGMLRDNTHYYNWYANDCWGIGCILYYILTGGSSLFTGVKDESHGTRMCILNDIFGKLGKPTISDGYIYNNYDKYKAAPGSQHYLMREKPGVLESKLRQKFAYTLSESNTAGFVLMDKLIYVTTQLLQYNPERRMTVGDALRFIYHDETLPSIILTKSLHGYLNTDTRLDRSIIRESFDIICYESGHTTIDPVSRWIIVDRACHYLNFYFNYYAEDMLKHPSYKYAAYVAALTALYISASLFNSYSSYAFSFEVVSHILKTRIHSTGKSRDIISSLKMFVKSGMFAYGYTIFDYINAPGIDLNLVGITNFMAIRSGCYKKYFGRNTDLIKALRRIISMGKFTIYTPEDIGDFTVTLDKLMRFADSL